MKNYLEKWLHLPQMQAEYECSGAMKKIIEGDWSCIPLIDVKRIRLGRVKWKTSLEHFLSPIICAFRGIKTDIS